jgi:hypothetical protein
MDEDDRRFRVRAGAIEIEPVVGVVAVALVAGVGVVVREVRRTRLEVLLGLPVMVGHQVGVLEIEFLLRVVAEDLVGHGFAVM